MREQFTIYATGDVDSFQDFLEHPDILPQDKEAMLEAVSRKGWDECLEVWISRQEPMLKTKHGQQAWLTMAGECHTDCWMQMVPIYLQCEDSKQWQSALQCCKEEAKYVQAWDIYSLASVLQQLDTPSQGGSDLRYLSLVHLRIQLMHGMDRETANESVANSFVAQALHNATKTPENVFEGLSWQ